MVLVKQIFNLQKVRFSANLKVKNLSKDQIIKLIKTIETLNIELASDLKKAESLITKNFSFY
jgi:ribosomal protein S13